MCATNGFAVAAFVVSMASLALSTYAVVRDRGTITASARYPKRFRKVLIHVVNSGRRPVTLRRLVLQARGGEHYEYPLLKGEESVRLMESEAFEGPLPAPDQDVSQWANTEFSKCEIEDSRGKKYSVDGLAKLLSEYATDLSTAI
jgi:hypothetical protein